MGSKNRIAKEILPIITKDLKRNIWYVEPFVGGCNMIDKVGHDLRMGSDVNEYLIEFWLGLQSGWTPDEYYSKDRYLWYKNNKNVDKKSTGYVGICCSYSGKWFGGYAGKVKTSVGTVRDYIEESYNNIEKQRGNLKDVVFLNKSYKDLQVPYSSIVYCDPPYERTTKYGDNDFDHSQFWDWCRELKSKRDCTVFVSEYNAPDDFKCVWEKEVKSSLSANGKSGKSITSVEKLFTL